MKRSIDGVISCYEWGRLTQPAETAGSVEFAKYSGLYLGPTAITGQKQSESGKIIIEQPDNLLRFEEFHVRREIDLSL